MGAPFTFSYDFKGLMRKHNGMEKVFGPMLGQAYRTGMWNAAQFLRDEVRHTSPKRFWGTLTRLGKGKGYYVDDIDWPKTGQLAAGEFHLMASFRHWEAVEFGRPAIFPKRKKFLYIPLKQGASKNPYTDSYGTPLKNLKHGTDFVFAKKAASAPAQHIVENAWKSNQDKMVEMVNHEIVYVLNKLGI